MKTLGEIINQYRKVHKMSMGQFANISGLSKSYVSMLEKNYNPISQKEIIPTIETISKVSNAMKIDFDELFNQLGNQLVSVNFSQNNDVSKLLDDTINPSTQTTQTNGNGDRNSNTTNNITNNYSNCTESQMESIVKTNSNTTPKNNNIIFKIIDRMKEMNPEQLEQLSDYAYFITRK